jgi:cobalt-zinc-cadmium efflux system outer membrane protein
MKTKSWRAIAIAVGVLVVHVTGSRAQTMVSRLGAPQPAAQIAQGPVAWSLNDLIAIGLRQNPALAQASFDIQGAQGKAKQAGLYPNPVFNFSADELGDRTGPGGILAPSLSQEIVLGGKLRLARASAQREVDQAGLALQSQRYVLLTTVRQGYFEVLTAQRRTEALAELAKLGKASLDQADKLYNAKPKQIAELDYLPFQVEYERLVAE